MHSPIHKLTQSHPKLLIGDLIGFRLDFIYIDPRIESLDDADRHDIKWSVKSRSEVNKLDIFYL